MQLARVSSGVHLVLRGDMMAVDNLRGCRTSCHGLAALTGLAFPIRIEQLEAFDQPGIFSDGGFGKGQVTSIGRR